MRMTGLTENKSAFIKPNAESLLVLNRIVQQYGIDIKDLLIFYSDVYTSEILDKIFDGTIKDIEERHRFTIDSVAGEYDLRKRASKCTIIPFGKGQVNQYGKKYPTAKVWVVNVVTNKQKKIYYKNAILTVDYDVLKRGFFNGYEGIHLFNSYSDVKLKKKHDRALSVDDRAFPLPPAEPLDTFTAKEFFQSLSVKRVQMSELIDDNKLSSLTKYNTPRYYDIKCIPNVTVLDMKSYKKSFKGFNYTIGYIDISDGSHDGIMTDDGRIAPLKFRCWVNSDYLAPKKSYGDVYGVLRKNKDGEVIFDLCYFDVEEYGEEDLDDKNKWIAKSLSQKSTSKTSKKKMYTSKKNYSLKSLIKQTNAKQSESDCIDWEDLLLKELKILDTDKICLTYKDDSKQSAYWLLKSKYPDSIKSEREFRRRCENSLVFEIKKVETAEKGRPINYLIKRGSV